MNQLTGFPDFFVMGAPRCGTTSLCRYLRTIRRSAFRGRKSRTTSRSRQPCLRPRELRARLHRALFRRPRPGHRIAGEGSVSYLVPAGGVIERIRHFNPDARFVVMLRNPMSMLPSYHLKMRFLLAEDEADFATAWRLQEARARGESLPRHCLDARTLMYREVANFGAQHRAPVRLGGPRAHARDRVRRFRGGSAGDVPRRAWISSASTTTDGPRFVPRNESRTYRHRWLQQLLLRAPLREGSNEDVAQRVARKHKHERVQEGELGSAAGGMEQDVGVAIPAHAGNARRRRRASALGQRLLGRLLRRDLSFWLANPAVPPAPLVGALAQVRETA